MAGVCEVRMRVTALITTAASEAKLVSRRLTALRVDLD